VTPHPRWLDPVVEAARTITVHDLTRFMPPEDNEDARHGAVLVLFADGHAADTTPDDPDHRGELLLTERAHHMRSHPGQVSFVGGSLDPGEDAVAGALREGHEEIGLDPARVDVLGELPDLWLPPTNYVVTPVLGWWRERDELGPPNPDEVHAVHHVAIAELLDPAHRVSVRHPGGWVGPGFLIGEDKDLVLWGFTAGIIARLFDHIGWTRPWDRARVRDLPAYMLQGGATAGGARQNTRFDPRLEE
jgi:8-oxo-dGTP pyrophosphatase MutT (NUDIX family)